MNRYRTTGSQGSAEPGSGGRVMANRLGITDQESLDEAEAELQLDQWQVPAWLEPVQQSGLLPVTLKQGQLSLHARARLNAKPLATGQLPMLRIDEMPEVEVIIIDSTAGPEGVGEPGTSPVAPAVANAIFQLTGKRLRSLPPQRSASKLSMARTPLLTVRSALALSAVNFQQ